MSQNCRSLTEGVFEINTEMGTTIIERFGEWQLEKNIDYDVIYLNKIDKINSCEFIINLYRIINKGTLPDLGSSNAAHIRITEVKKDTFYFKTTLLESGFIFYNKFIKKSDKISSEFKNIINKIEEQ